MSQTEKIKRHFKAGKALTSLQALRLFGTLRLSGRVLELREQGMNIKTEMVEVNKKRIARYRCNSWYL